MRHSCVASPLGTTSRLHTAPVLLYRIKLIEFTLNTPSGRSASLPERSSSPPPPCPNATSATRSRRRRRRTCPLSSATFGRRSSRAR
ncbi:uncharacterized protein SCHCODRAFT_01262355 [Schizophyllum commune H4-8]|uniref:uncharacterized protein n=1 Tax=Schizophyllum commune (strain H4-8 / FGSC 9210) TaxID=578458 RepID=UPI00215F5F19|nr:uncharacterized protein SCHCODRAFT_01262355 [Schizophyllum commune H4-8]KAI5886572.1 hypothetical protein SCHCODRAFT_01262355 [Schizophyllum commune H4-8]